MLQWYEFLLRTAVLALVNKVRGLPCLGTGKIIFVLSNIIACSTVFYSASGTPRSGASIRTRDIEIGIFHRR
jgi:hypothetical protein